MTWKHNSKPMLSGFLNEHTCCRETTERLAKQDGLVGLRRRPVDLGDYPFHALDVLTADGDRLLFSVRYGEQIMPISCSCSHLTFFLIGAPRCEQTRLVVIVIHAVLETCLAFLNHFPLFAMMLRVKDPLRLPGEHLPPLIVGAHYLCMCPVGGIYFDMSETSRGYIELKVN